ncbi:MAG: DUF1294 domain-containing protein [Sphingomonas taxi]|uniref:DUF1294 domain-containing protein n=1 Tax=Sphingomonas taxi TaxID=1549858 RepID=A0A2W4YX10_9SPHN|nr:MAG: DUF1294 domain-containing protein [Sphingomonas taxi]
MILPIFAALVRFLIINMITVAAFAIDKRRSSSGAWRIPESRLLWFAALGGTPGAFWARNRYRHKTRKQPFVGRLQLIAMVQVGLGAGLAIAFVI